MGQEMNSEYYNNIFSKTDHYDWKYVDSYYYSLWKELLSKLPKGKILEVGCGTGQLADMLYENGHTDYVGLDFSSVAIEMAKRRCPQINFLVGNAYDSNLYQDYDIIIATEIFEHLDDIEVLNNIEEGKVVLFTVPQGKDPAHVRRFRNTMAVKERYEQYFDNLTVSNNNKHFLAYGTRRKK